MKRINDAQVTSTVSGYLKKRNYSLSNNINSNNKTRMRTCQTREMIVNTLVSNESSLCDIFNNSACVSDVNNRADDIFLKFNKFVTESQDVYKEELSQLTFPLFVHLFIELFQCGHRVHAKKIFLKHQGLFGSRNTNDNRSLIDSMAHSLSAQSLDSTLKVFKNAKYGVKISPETLDYLVQYLEKTSDSILLQIMHCYFDISIVKRNSCGLDLQPNASNSLLLSQLTPSAEQNSLPLLMATSTDANKEDLLKAIQKVNSNKPCIPSICYCSLNSCYLSSVAVSQDIKYIAGGFENSSIYLWDLSIDEVFPSDNGAMPSQLTLAVDQYDEESDTDEQSQTDISCENEPNSDSFRVLRGHNGTVYDMCFTNASNYLLSCSEDTTVRLWDLNTFTNAVIYTGHMYPVWAIDCSPFDLYFATGSKDSTARLWSIERSSPLRLFCGHTMDVDCVAFHPNCNYLASGSADKTVRLWSVNEGRMLRLFSGHRGGIHCLAFSPNGKLLASAGEDRRIKIWDLSTGSVLKEFRGHTDTVLSLSFNYNESILASCGMDQTLRLWNLQVIGEETKSDKGSPEQNNVNADNSNAQLANYSLKCRTLLKSRFMQHNLLMTICKQTT